MTVRFSPSVVIILPFLLTTVIGVGSYTVPPVDTENGLLTSTASPGEMLQGFHIGLVVSMSFHLELL